MRKIGLFIFLIITCLFFSSTYCEDEYNFFNVQFINNSGSDIRLFRYSTPNENYSYTQNDFDENGGFQYKVKDNDTINYRDVDCYDSHLFVINEKKYIEIYKNTDFDKIIFDKYYLLRYNEIQNGNIIINYKE